MDIKKKIEEIINENDVCLFMKGTPESPQCGFSMAVSNVLKHLKPVRVFIWSVVILFFSNLDLWAWEWVTKHPVDPLSLKVLTLLFSSPTRAVPMLLISCFPPEMSKLSSSMLSSINPSALLLSISCSKDISKKKLCWYESHSSPPGYWL